LYDEWIMVAKTHESTRMPLSRERVLAAAVELADVGGINALTMRSLAASLDVEAMSLYYHVANKEALLDGIAEAVVEEVNAEVALLGPADPAVGWQTLMRERVLAARMVMLRHRWAPAILETRTTMNLPVLLYFDGVVGIFRDGGFSHDLIHHAMHALGSRALGFSQEMFNPAPGSEDDSASETIAELAALIPNLIAMLGEVAHDDPDSTIGWCDDQSEFEFSIDVMLDGFERLRVAESERT
jgi:AcrR family transcriptional regulator